MHHPFLQIRNYFQLIYNDRIFVVKVIQLHMPKLVIGCTVLCFQRQIFIYKNKEVILNLNSHSLDFCREGYFFYKYLIQGDASLLQIGRASCRERVYLSV